MSTHDDINTFVLFLWKTFVDEGNGSTIVSTIKNDNLRKIVHGRDDDRDSEDTLVSATAIAR